MNEQCRETAYQIGAEVAHTAIWHEDRCNWLGAPSAADEASPVSGQLAALGSDLYSGTAGIALFLAELYFHTGDALLRRTALGAIRHALSHAGDDGSRMGAGLYVGHIGIAVAAARIGERLGEPALLEQAASLAHRMETAPDEDGGFDMISGRAGSIVGLLVLRSMLDDACLVGAAAQLADQLSDTARTGDGWYAWSAGDSARAGPPLTGFSHGCSGVGHALLELAAITGDDVYRRTADRAFRYEQQLFDPAEQNWPDLRGEPRNRGQGRGRRRTPSFATAWCHGAPGIVLSRLRGHQLFGDQTWRAEATAGMANIHTMLTTSLTARRGNYSLCHGLTGNAEVLLHADEILGMEEGHRTLALRVAEAGIERYAGLSRSWPCGTPVGATPNLLLGLAGIGLFYLRLAEATVPSVLLMRPESWSAIQNNSSRVR